MSNYKSISIMKKYMFDCTYICISVGLIPESEIDGS